MASVDLQEKANFTRLSRLLVDKGTEGLRNTFDTIHPLVSLPGVLAANKTSLQKLKPRVINNSQWDLLFPPSGNPPDSKTFDVTLLTVLLRNICGFPSTGWSVMPPDTDRSTQANITRIRRYRNEVIAHVTTTRVDNLTFESLWKKISQAIVELGVSQSDVDDLGKRPLGPEEEMYVQKLKDLELREDECNKKLATIECSVKNVKQIAEENRDEIDKIRQSHTNPEKKSRTESDEDLLRKLAKHNFKSKIKRKLNFFLKGTRGWLLEEVNAWFQMCDNDSRIKLITAGPGFGKSVFAAKICDDFEKNGKLAACHFCDFNNSNLRDPMVMLESLASQMCKSVPGFKEMLLDQLGRRHQVQNLKDAFQIYLQNPLDELEIKEPRLVVIDGLDESAADNKNEITHLIAEYFPDLPEYTKILVTSRPEISVADLRLRDEQKTDIANVDDNNNSDLELYFKECFPSLVGREVDRSEISDDFYEDHPYLDRESDIDESDESEISDDFYEDHTLDLLSIFVAKCQGSFLYAYHFQSGLRARYDLEKITNNDVMEFLPEGLHSVYERYFERLEDELSDLKHEKFDVLNILAMLVASEEDLPLTFVAQAFGLAPDCRETKDIINKINEIVSCLLYVSDDMLTVFHTSVIDWLLAKGYKDHQYTVKVNDGHRSLWPICEKVFKEIVESVRSGVEVKFTHDVKYALKHGLKHLEKCEMEEGYFSDDKKKIAETLLSNLSPFVEPNSYEVSVLPRAVWKCGDFDHITAVALSNDEKSVAVGVENVIHVISLPTLVESMRYSTNSNAILCCTFSPDDSLILFGKLETAFNIAGRKEVPFFPGNGATFRSCAFSPNGKRLVTSNGSNTIEVWDVAEQKMVSSLHLGFPVLWFSFSVTGLFFIADSESSSYPGYSSSALNDITLQRSDKRKLSHGEREKPVVLKSRKCERCFQRGFEEPSFKHLEIRTKNNTISCPWICKCVECIISPNEYCFSSVTESIPLTAIVAWNYLATAPSKDFLYKLKLILLGDNLWLYSDYEKLIVFKTLAPKQEQSCLSHPTEVYSSSFSPDGSRLASCNSDGYINVWNVYTGQVDQRFKSSQCGSMSLCWWSEDFLFVISEFNRILKLTRYPVDDNLEILFTHSQDVALDNLPDFSHSKPIRFSEGFFSLGLERNEPVKVLDVRDVDGPVMINLPGIEPEMQLEISPGGAFISGCNKNKCYIWKRNTENLTSYEVFYHRDTGILPSVVIFSNDPKVAIVMHRSSAEIIDLDTGDSQNIILVFWPIIYFRSFCIYKCGIVLTLSENLIVFFDMDSGAILNTSYQPYLQTFWPSQTIQLSPKEDVLSFPDRKGDMVFLPLSIPQNPLLDDVKRRAVALWDDTERRALVNILCF
ncbi:uncharacterized protein LOC114525121 isoform X2 [Dendronephthya gigantea]|uniref:uncharacterized protein LOC114525121 isoform X2 n=1 Tax=Dendronephthya gigantea TaxID=151771 RepID=UPI00106A7DB5|nr:uncharacterized protein LOC114525121 isoform X2 [Dendronephthya gigantea]